MSVIMYNKNTPLLVLEMEGIFVKKVKKILNQRLLPICFYRKIGQEKVFRNELNLWIEKRLISDKRENIDNVRKEFPSFENYSCMFSLSDQYWFRYNTDQTWEDLNFFTNDYSDDVGRVFFTPWGIEPSEVGSPSPDLTTNGVLLKTWRKENGIDYLYKAGSEFHHQQPISEVLASLLLKKLNFLPFVEYELDIYGLKLCSKCRNFVDKNSEFVPASYIYYLEKRNPNTDTIYSHFLKMCDKFGIKGVQDYLDKMIAADKIIGNDDRHFGNFGFIRNVETGEITDFAPLFDSGSSFYGVSHKEKGARMFEEQSLDAVKRVIQKYDLSAALDYSQMFDLIDKHPEIPWAKKEEIKKRIIENTKKLKEMTDMVSLELQEEFSETPTLTR